MSRWRRGPAAPDPDPTERMPRPERSWDPAPADPPTLFEPAGGAPGGSAEPPTELIDPVAAEPAADDRTLQVPPPVPAGSGPDAIPEAATRAEPDAGSGPAGAPDVPAAVLSGQAVPADEPPGAPGDRPAPRAGAREEILGRVRAAVGGRPEPEGDVPRSYRRSLGLSRDDVVALFAERVADYTATVWPIPREQLAASIAVRLVERGIRRIAVPADMPASLLPQYVEVRVDHGDLTGLDLDAVDGVVTGCALAIAETGTIVLDGGRMQGRRLLSLVPDYHLCVVDALDVVGSLPEALARLNPARPITFVSGPSATSDIELNRIEGVHGPRTLDVLLTR